MDLACVHLPLAPHWVRGDDRRRILLVEAIDAIKLCGSSEHERVDPRETIWLFQEQARELGWKIEQFLARCRWYGFKERWLREHERRELVVDAIRHGNLVGVRRVRQAAVEVDATIAQRLLVRDIARESGGRLDEGGRRYRLVAGADADFLPDRNRYEVVRHDEGARVLRALVTAGAAGGKLSALLTQALALLSLDWRPPLSPKGLVLLRRIAAERVAASATGPAITPSQMRAMMEASALAIHVVDLDGTPQAGLAFAIRMPDGGDASGKLDEGGRGQAKSSAPGVFTVRFPELDGADWDGDGALDLPAEEERGEASRQKATVEDRVPVIARERGFRNWRTVWRFVGNQKLREERENPNVLWDGDEVVVPSRVERVAEVAGGQAEYVVQARRERVVNLRLLDADLVPFAGVRYQANVGEPAENRGVVPDSGWVTLDVPAGTNKVVFSLYLSENPDDPPFEWECAVQDAALGDSAAGKAQRLCNLGFASKVPEGEAPGDDFDLGLFGYRAWAEDQEADDAALLADLLSTHDDGDDEEQA